MMNTHATAVLWLILVRAQIVVICGRNEKLKARLQGQQKGDAEACARLQPRTACSHLRMCLRCCFRHMCVRWPAICQNTPAAAP